jgi:hypothetical protein
MSGEEGADPSLARRYFEELLNAGELAVADEILDPDISFVGPITPDGIDGLDAYKQFAPRVVRGVPGPALRGR